MPANTIHPSIARKPWPMRYSLVALVWLGLITHVTVSGLAPAFLNADVILNSVMSLQNITPFYWGQNRLLNVVPLLAWPLRDPALNLLAILYLNTGLYYLVLWIFARGAVALTAVHAQSREWLTTAVFVSLSSAALLILTPQAAFELSLWHHEYTLPLVLLGAALLLAHLNPVRASAGKTWLMALCLFVALGVNPASILVLGLNVVTYCLVQRKISLGIRQLAFLGGLFFFFWSAVSIPTGGLTYYTVVPQSVLESWKIVWNQLGAILHSAVAGPALLALCFASLGMALWQLFQHRHDTGEGRVAFNTHLVIAALLSFAAVWTAGFSAHHWVAANAYHWRYFIYAVLAIAAMFTIQFSMALRRIGKTASVFIAGALGVAACVQTYLPARHPEQFNVYAQVDQLSKQSYAFYSGDYWLVWPAVHRDLMRGKEAFGLTLRGNGNATKALAFARHQSQSDGTFTVLCLAAPAAKCMQQVSETLGSVEAGQVIPIGNDAAEIRFRLMASATSPQ